LQEREIIAVVANREPWKKGTALVLHGFDPVTITLIKRSEKMR
jgi:hypothetical protein